ncbi:hypothetical protein [Streptomyces sp. NPDC088923]|uniref:hypothetical protein n=1 Tax=Streptomyces sp. NPDC088923 TaxID=3365913 RepID=UPI00382A8048
MLRAALEPAIEEALEAAVPGLAGVTMRARPLCLPSCTSPLLAARARAVCSHLCLGCHYHPYEIGPTESQVRAWRAEAGELVGSLAY